MHATIRSLCAALAAIALSTTGCGGGPSTGAGASSAVPPVVSGELPIRKLETLKAQLSESITEVTRPLDEGPAVLDELEALLESARSLSVAEPTPVEPVVTDAVVELEGTGGATLEGSTVLPPLPEVAKPDYEALVVSIIVSVVNTGREPAQLEVELPAELRAEAQRIGERLSDLLASLVATDERVVAVGTAAAGAVVEIPKIAAEATADARLQLDDPNTSAQAKTRAQQTLQRVEAVARGVQADIALVQQKLDAAPVRAQELVLRAQTLLAGASLSPPALEVAPPQLVAASVAPTVSPPASTQCAPVAVDKGSDDSAPWGWYVAAGASAIGTGAGVALNLAANKELERCQDPVGFGCANYDRIRQERDVGIVVWSAGAALTASFVTFILVTEVQSEGPKQQATLWCSPGYAGAHCSGTF